MRKLRFASTLALGEKQRIENSQKMGEATEKALIAVREMVKKNRDKFGHIAPHPVAARILKHYSKKDAARIIATPTPKLKPKPEKKP